MTSFEYLSVLVSIILGLGLTHLLSAARDLIQRRAEIQFHWLPLLWAALILLAQIEWWWGLFEFRARTEWNFFSFLFLLLSPVSMYLTAGIVLPQVEDGVRDLKQYYFDSHRWLFSLAGLTNLLDATRALAAGVDWGDPRVWSNLAAVSIFAAMAMVRNQLFHIIVTLLLAMLFLVFVIISRLRIV
jgi:hypothetical protein